MPEKIKTREQFQELLAEGLAELGPQVMIDAMAKNPDALRKTLEGIGFIVSDPAAVRPSDVLAAHDDAILAGRILGGFGASYREACSHHARQFTDRRTGKKRVTYLADPDIARMAYDWIDAIICKRRERSLEICDKLNEATRAPSNPLTTEPGTSGAQLVPTIVAAEIFEETTERFVLRGLVQSFTNAGPLRIPRRVALITVSRGAPATNLTEADPNILGSVSLSPEWVGALAYVQPRLAMAASVGPVRYIIEQFAEALARDDQRVIIAGDPNLREPTGINTLPTADDNAWDNINTSTWDNTNNTTRRAAIRAMLYQLTQYHRGQPAYKWMSNGDFITMAAGLNDTDVRDFYKDGDGSLPERMLNKEVVETTALATSGNATTLLGGDLNQYAWLEAPGGLRIDQTEIGGEAWVSDTIGIKVIQEVDGAPVIPQAFVKMASIDV